MSILGHCAEMREQIDSPDHIGEVFALLIVFLRNRVLGFPDQEASAGLQRANAILYHGVIIVELGARVSKMISRATSGCWWRKMRLAQWQTKPPVER